MSHTIWTQCAASSERIRALEHEVFRVVESQFENSTRKLVDSDDEQRVLEELLERVKPPVPSGPEFEHLHYLLFTPFRYPPLRYGSRFGRTHERGIWYGALERRTCFAETAYYRLLFLEHTKAVIEPLHVDLTCFAVGIRTTRGVDLTAPPFRRYRRQLVSKTSYAVTHELGTDMRAAGIEAFLFPSARDPEHGTNVGLFTPCFAEKDVSTTNMQAWRCIVDRAKVEFRRRLTSRASREQFSFTRDVFLVDGVLPRIATNG